MLNREDIQEWKSYSSRPYPRMNPWTHVYGLLMFAVIVGVGTWVGHPMIGFFAGTAAIVILLRVAHPLRCPQCKGPVRTREAEEEAGYRRFLHDCSACRITWECEKHRPSES
jgi:hypothetical protein